MKKGIENRRTKAKSNSVKKIKTPEITSLNKEYSFEKLKGGVRGKYAKKHFL